MVMSRSQDTGADSAAHLSEETKDAGVVVPRAMFYSFLANSVLGIIMLLAFLACLTDVDAATNDSSGYSFIWVFNQGMSLAGVNVLSSILIIFFFGSTVAFNMSTSRQTFAFARDHGLPFSNWLARVESKRQIPQNALLLTCAITIILIMINIGSSTAFYALVSLNVATLMLSYVFSIGALIWTHLTNPEILPRGTMLFHRPPSSNPSRSNHHYSSSLLLFANPDTSTLDARQIWFVHQYSSDPLRHLHPLLELLARDVTHRLDNLQLVICHICRCCFPRYCRLLVPRVHAVYSSCFSDQGMEGGLICLFGLFLIVK